jgi:hypothetical protein
MFLQFSTSMLSLRAYNNFINYLNALGIHSARVNAFNHLMRLDLDLKEGQNPLEEMISRAQNADKKYQMLLNLFDTLIVLGVDFSLCQCNDGFLKQKDSSPGNQSSTIGQDSKTEPKAESKIESKAESNAASSDISISELIRAMTLFLLAYADSLGSSSSSNRALGAFGQALVTGRFSLESLKTHFFAARSLILCLAKANEDMDPAAMVRMSPSDDAKYFSAFKQRLSSKYINTQKSSSPGEAKNHPPAGDYQGSIGEAHIHHDRIETPADTARTDRRYIIIVQIPKSMIHREKLRVLLRHPRAEGTIGFSPSDHSEKNLLHAYKQMAKLKYLELHFNVGAGISMLELARFLISVGAIIPRGLVDMAYLREKMTASQVCVSEWVQNKNLTVRTTNGELLGYPVMIVGFLNRL